MTQEGLSHLSSATQGHLSEIEAEKRNASVDVTGAIALALGVPVGMLFDEPAGTTQPPAAARAC